MKSAFAVEPEAPPSLDGLVYCPSCTHSVPASVTPAKRAHKVLPGQRCSRCSSKLDAAVVIKAFSAR
jgi:hypothetical protein